MLTLITPCVRPLNLEILRRSIDIDLIDRWIIVHDTTQTGGSFSPVFDHPKILELGHMSPPGTCSGNSQRNVALARVKWGMVYFLDDDNVVHPEFWNLVPRFKEGKFYTFDQQRWDEFVSTPGAVFKGDTPRLQKIDTAQYVVDVRMTQPWKEDDYKADGLFIEDIYLRFHQDHEYIPIVASYYNYLRRM
jgi:hypothetical protein